MAWLVESLRNKSRLAAANGLIALGLLSGCAGLPSGPAGGEPFSGATAEEDIDQEFLAFLDISDPLEGLNRQVYAFNYLFDRYVFLPAVDAYAFVLPDVLRDRISDFFANILSLVTLANQVLQLKLPEAGLTAFRFGVNSTLGLFGFVDLASAVGMPSYQEDFGQTFGFWGAGPGPYLVLPVLGPSNLRDAIGWCADTLAFGVVDPFGASSFQTEYPQVLAVNIIDQRYTQSFRYFETGSPFEYDLIRLLYTKKRALDIAD
jgi:phospholipid-binding lipoprotein MlaA